MKLLAAIHTYVQAKRDLGHIFIADCCETLGVRHGNGIV
jgi:hypothetical protein